MTTANVYPEAEKPTTVPAVILDGAVLTEPGSANIPNVEVNTVKGVITLKYPDGSEVTKEIPVKEVLVSKPLCNVGVTGKFVKNMGKYQSATVGASLNIPAEYHEINEVFAFARGWVDEKMQEMVNSLGGS